MNTNRHELNGSASVPLAKVVRVVSDPAHFWNGNLWAAEQETFIATKRLERLKSQNKNKMVG
jgi:hypothetical protein